VGLERGPLSLLSTTEELLGRKPSGFGLGSREYGHGDLSRWPRCTFYPQEFALPSPTSGGRSVGIVRSRTQATECFYVFLNKDARSSECSSLWLQIFGSLLINELRK
jgi:hypothetical protein